MPSVTHLGQGENGSMFRVRLEAERAAMQMDMRLTEVQSLVEDGLEALVAASKEQEECPFCDPDKPGHCDLKALLQSMLGELHR